MCLNNLKEYQDAITHCDAAMKVDPNTAKAYYFKSQALNGLNDLEKAIDCMKKCIRIMPNDRKLRQELEKMNEELKK